MDKKTKIKLKGDNVVKLRMIPYERQKIRLNKYHELIEDDQLNELDELEERYNDENRY